MKKGWKIVGVAVLIAILGLAGVSAVALAQAADTGSSSPFDFATRFREALAGVLGISVDQYNAAVDKAEKQVVDEAVAEGWLTDEQAEMLQWRLDQHSEEFLGKGMGFGMRGGPMGFRMGGSDSLYSVAADKLGMKLTELLTELQKDKSIADVAKDKGVDTQSIIDAYVAQAKAKLDESVADGDITQKQADFQLEQLTDRVTDQVDSTGVGGHMERGRHGGGMGLPEMGGF
jgi:hypothetical protein